MAANVFGGSAPKQAVAYAPPEPKDEDFGPKFKVGDHYGKAVAIDVAGAETRRTKYGDKLAVSASQIVTEDGDVYTDQLLFNATARDLYEQHNGERVTVAIVQGTTKGGDPYAKFIAPSATQVDKVNAALAAADSAASDDKPPF